jgi:hypothetical protein
VILVERWIAEWQDLASFEVVPVVPGSETAAAIGSLPEVG